MVMEEICELQERVGGKTREELEEEMMYDDLPQRVVNFQMIEREEEELIRYLILSL